MAQAFVLGVNLRIQQVLGLEQVKQQLASIQIGGAGQTQQLSAALKSVSTNAAAVVANTTALNTLTTKLGKNVSTTGKNLKNAGKHAQNFGDQIAIAGRRYAAFLGATTAAFKVIQLISAGTKTVIEFDQAMVSLSQIIDTTRDQLGDLEQQFIDLSVSTGTSAAEIASAAKLLAQAGFRGAELAEATEQLAKVPLTPIFESMEQAVDGAIAAMRQFPEEGLTVERVFDKMINVSNKYAASFPDIIEGLKRGGSAFQAIGGTLDEFIAAFTTIRSVTRESSSSVGTSLKTLASRLADPKIIKFLETKNIRLLEAGQFVGPLEAIRRIGDGLERTENVQDRINIATKLGGRRQISRFLAVAQNAEKTSEILDVSKDSFDAFNRVAEQGLLAVGKQVDILISKANALAISLGESLFIPFIQGLTGAADSAISLLGTLKPLLPAIASIGTALTSMAIFKGIGSFLGPKIAGLAGPAAFAAAGGGVKGAAAGLGASPFLQAGLLMAAGQAAGALLKTADGADTLASSIVSTVTTITAVLALMKGQTIAKFATTGGLFAGLGAVGGGLLTAAAIVAPLVLMRASKSAQELMDKITDSAVEAVDAIELDSTDDSKSFTTGMSSVVTTISDAMRKSIESIDPYAANISIKERLSRVFQASGRAAANAWEGDFEFIVKRWGLTSANLRDQLKAIIDKSPGMVNSIIDNITKIVASADINLEKLPSYAKQKITTDAVLGGATQESAAIFADVVVEAAGGVKALNEEIQKSANIIRNEAQKREKMIPLINALVPQRLVGQLLQFSKAVNKVTRAVDLSAKMFSMQIADIGGGISAPSFDFDFGDQQIKRFIGAGGLEELFAFTPDIPKFIGGLTEVESLLDQFIINISNVPASSADLLGEVDKFFEFQTDVPKVVRDNFEEFFRTIAQDIALVSEGEYINTDTIKSRFEKEFANLGVGASDAVVENIRGFLEATFTQVQDELNRLATVRKFELAAPVLPGTQADFLEQQLRRAGVSVGGGRGPTNVVRGTLEELDLRRRESLERYGRETTPGLLPTPEPGFFQDRTKRLADIAGDETIRQQVRDGFREVVIESTRVKKQLAELKPGTEGFIAAAQNAKELARTTVELQTAMEALIQASGKALESEKQTLALRQKLELSQTEARLAKRVEKGYTTPTEAERITSDLMDKQERAQIALQDKYASIMEKDNTLRANLAKEISANTKTQDEITQNFDTSVGVFSDSTRIQAKTIELMNQAIIQFGQSVVDFRNFGATTGPATDMAVAGITPTQIKSGAVNVQQGFDEYVRLINDSTANQNDIANILKATLERFEQINPTAKEPTTIQKEREQSVATDEKISLLTDSLDNLRTVLNEPNELKLITDQRIDLDLSTLPSDISAEIRPLLEEAVIVAAKTVARKTLESLASKSEAEFAVVATNVARELA